MKSLFLALGATLFLSACAGTNVVRTQVATGELNPKSIYIRPFHVEADAFRGSHHGKAAKAIRQSQAPQEFAEVLKEELEKIAPALVLKENEVPVEGWIVEGNIDKVQGGYLLPRGLLPHLGIGQSSIRIHVRVLKVGVPPSSDGKGGTPSNVIYEFDIAGGSRLTGPAGSVMASGWGNSVPFDYRNAAERIAQVFTPDGPRYAVRSSQSLR